MMIKDTLFVDYGYAQCNYFGERICGDAIGVTRIPEEDRFIAVLSDGLGHGVKANILSTMTTTMALRFVAEDDDIYHAAEIIMDTLPICQVRKISYATFTIVDIRLNGESRVIEMGNPAFILLRNGVDAVLPFETFDSPKHENRTMSVYNFKITAGDRLLFFSDGVSQAGLGSPAYPLGWRRSGCLRFTEDLLKEKSDLSSHELSNAVLSAAIAKENNREPRDDITCAAIHFRCPKKLMIFTGPPFNKERDAAAADMLRQFKGQKVVCGGTSAEIVSREFGEKLTMDLSTVGRDLPPISRLKGVDLVTEGIFTLTRAAQYLERGDRRRHADPAGMIVDMLLGNDIIEFIVGTRINEAHQDPNLPIDLEIRRNIIKRISKTLQEDYLKEVLIKFV